MNIAYLLALHSLPEIGSVRLGALLDYFGDPEAAWRSPDRWRAALGVNLDYALIRQEMRQRDVSALYEQFLRSDAKVVTLPEPRYPSLLREIYDPPYLLFYRGELPGDDDLCLAIIGSRRATAYGQAAARYLADGLARAGAWIVAGLARGIDSAGHQAALDAGGKTIGVLGCGLDVVYPRENRRLFEAVAASGCIISEFPLGMQPLARNFPIRNRIVSGLSQGVIVVEAGLKSGTQITVDYALDQGRNIYAVPGSIFSPASLGTHRLIQDVGVKLVATAEDILVDFCQPPKEGGEGISVRQSLFDQPPPELSPEEKRLWLALSFEEGRHFNDLTAELALSPAALAPLLTVCELKGCIKRLDGQYYIRKK